MKLCETDFNTGEKMEDYYWFGQHGTNDKKYMQINA